jgi:hypothetical protein
MHWIVVYAICNSRFHIYATRILAFRHQFMYSLIFFNSSRRIFCSVTCLHMCAFFNNSYHFNTSNIIIRPSFFFRIKGVMPWAVTPPQTDKHLQPRNLGNEQTNSNLRKCMEGLEKHYRVGIKGTDFQHIMMISMNWSQVLLFCE